MDSNEIINSVQNHMSLWGQSFFLWLPKVFGGIVVLLCGYIIAVLLRRGTFKLITKVEGLIPAKRLSHSLKPLGIYATTPVIFSGLIFWIVIIFSITIASDLLGLKIVTTWLEALSGYLPNLFAAALVGVIGFGAAVMLRDALKKSFQGTQMERLSRIAYWFVAVVALFLMAGQLKFDIQILILSAVVVLGATLGGAALAFGLGARLVVTNILSTHYLSKIYKIGDEVQINQIQGVVLEINPVAVILTTDKGNAVVPSKEFLERASIMNRVS